MTLSSESTAMPLITPKPRPVNLKNDPVEVHDPYLWWDDELGISVVPQHYLVGHAVVSDEGVILEIKVIVGDWYNRSKRISCDIGSEDDWNMGAADVGCEESSVPALDAADATNDVLLIDGRSPRRIQDTGTERVHRAKSALHIEGRNGMLALDQPD